MTRLVFDLAPDDERPPVAGEVLFTARTCYLITGSREVESRVWCNRWALTVERLGPRPMTPDDVDAAIPGGLPGGTRVHFSTRYRKGERPAEFFAAHGHPVAPPA